MATVKKSSTRGARSEDAIAMLIADHKKVKALFKEFENLKDNEGSNEEKVTVVKQVCDALTIHAEIEEEIFYPAVREAIEDTDLMDEALVEHAGAKELIAQLQGMDPDDDLYDAKVTVLGEQIDHHVKEEQGDMFVKAKRAKLDTFELGAKMAVRRDKLMAEMGISADDDVEKRARSPKKKK